MTVIAANAGRYPVSAQCRILGVPRSTYYHMLANPPAPPAPDPIEPDVLGAFGASRGGYGARRLKVALARSGITASRRRICRILRQNGLSSAYSGRGPGASRPAAPPDAANVLGRGFDGHRPRTHVAADLTYVRAGSRWCYVCLLVDLYNREIVGCSCGRRKDASLVKAAFSNVEFPLTGIEVFHSDRGAEWSTSIPVSGVNVNPSFTDSTNAIAPIAPTHPRRFRQRQAPFPASRSGARSFVR